MSLEVKRSIEWIVQHGLINISLFLDRDQNQLRENVSKPNDHHLAFHLLTLCLIQREAKLTRQYH